MSTPTPGTHIVLGGNGVIGGETLRALREHGIAAISLGRTPSPRPDVRSVIADLLDPGQIQTALQGIEVAYFTAGLPYSAAEWEGSWHKMLQNSIDACITHATLLVYLDNTYAYSSAKGPMTEQNEIHPTTRKGRVRAAALGLLEDAARSRGLSHTVGRSADFYGPGASTSVFNTYVLDKVANGRKPTWFFDATQPHSMTYTCDIGDALVTLGTDPRARGKEWHLPTAHPALTGEQYMRLATGSSGAHHTMSALTMRIGSVFNRSARETLEMAYEYFEPYRLDSSSFETTFQVTPTPYEQGIADTLAACRGALGTLATTPRTSRDVAMGSPQPPESAHSAPVDFPVPPEGSPSPTPVMTSAERALDRWDNEGGHNGGESRARPSREADVR